MSHPRHGHDTSLVADYLPPNDYHAKTATWSESYKELRGTSVLDTSIPVWASWHLDSAVMAFRSYEIAEPDGDDNIFGSSLQVAEITAFGGVFRACVSALDLCGAFLGAMATGIVPQHHERHSDIGQLTGNELNQLPVPLARWHKNLVDDANWELLQEFRHGVTHRRLRRHISVGSGIERGLALHVGEVPENIKTLLPRMIGFSGERFLSLLDLLLK